MWIYRAPRRRPLTVRILIRSVFQVDDKRSRDASPVDDIGGNGKERRLRQMNCQRMNHCQFSDGRST